MNLERRIELLHNSSNRMMEVVKIKDASAWLSFMKRELKIHLKRTLEIMWAVWIGR